MAIIASFLRRNWKGVLLIMGLFGLGISIPLRCLSIERQLAQNYRSLVTRGDLIRGRILKHEMFREVYGGKFGPRGREGIHVEIEYQDDMGQTRKIYETWLTDGKIYVEDKTEDDVQLYYLEDNNLVQAASIHHPRIKAAIKIAQYKMANKGARV